MSEATYCCEANNCQGPENGEITIERKGPSLDVWQVDTNSHEGSITSSRLGLSTRRRQKIDKRELSRSLSPAKFEHQSGGKMNHDRGSKLSDKLILIRGHREGLLGQNQKAIRSPRFMQKEVVEDPA